MIPVGRGSAGVAVAGGSVWVTNAIDGTVTRIDPQTNEVRGTIDVGGYLPRSRRTAATSGWRRMTRSARWAAAAVIAVGSIVAGCGAGARPDQDRGAGRLQWRLRLRLRVERRGCGASAPLPGWALAGAVPSAGVTGARLRVAPSSSDVVCTNGLPKEDTLAARRAVEIGGADIVIGPTSGTSGFVYRSYAKQQPEVTFVSGTGSAQATTLRDPAPNLFRFATEGTQWSAGLGTYAYRDLGWRRAAVVTED